METKSDPVIDSLILKVKTRQELAEEYGICVKTLKRRLEKVNIETGNGLIFPKTVKIIYETLGVPKSPKKS